MDTQIPRNSGNAPTKPALDASALEAWLVARVAELARQSEDEVDVLLPFSRYALDSVDSVGLTGDLEDLLGVTLPPTLLWDYPTIALLARHLAPSKAST